MIVHDNKPVNDNPGVKPLNLINPLQDEGFDRLASESRLTIMGTYRDKIIPVCLIIILS